MKNRWIRFLLVVPILLVIITAVYPDLRQSPAFIAPLVAALSLSICACAVIHLNLSLIALGVAVCLLPMLGNGALIVFSAAWLAGYEVNAVVRGCGDSHKLNVSEKLLVIGFLVFLLALFSGAVHAFAEEGDFLVFSSLFEGGGIHGILRYLKRHYAQWKDIPVMLSGYINCVLIVFALIDAERRSEGLSFLILGLAAGALGSAAVFFLQVWEIHPFFAMNQSEFWRMVGRYSASYTDPNAFGVMGALLIPLLCFYTRGRHRFCYTFSAFVLFCVLPWSGSRTFWLGLTLWAIVICVKALHMKFGGSAGRYSVGACTAALLFAVIVGYPPLNDWLADNSHLPSFSRAVKTINWNESVRMLSSRLTYSKIALRMWGDAPLIGVGLNRFYGEQERVARIIGIELGDWRDNANNYYLQVLAEGGLIGLLLVLCSFYLFQRALAGHPISHYRLDRPVREQAPPAVLLSLGNLSLAIFAVMLLTGPHLFFDEVKFLVCVFFAIAVSNIEAMPGRNMRRYTRLLYSAAVMCIVVCILSVMNVVQEDRTQGFYGREYSENDGAFAWTGKKAYLRLCGQPGKPLSLEFKALNPDLAANPLAATITRITAQGREVISDTKLANSNWKQAAISPKTKGDAELVEISVSRTWSPAGGNPKGDVRWLGLLVKWPKEAC